MYVNWSLISRVLHANEEKQRTQELIVQLISYRVYFIRKTDNRQQMRVSNWTTDIVDILRVVSDI